jgi:hypothetical protein
LASRLPRRTAPASKFGAHKRGDTCHQASPHRCQTGNTSPCRGESAWWGAALIRTALRYANANGFESTARPQLRLLIRSTTSNGAVAASLVLQRWRTSLATRARHAVRAKNYGGGVPGWHFQLQRVEKVRSQRSTTEASLVCIRERGSSCAKLSPGKSVGGSVSRRSRSWPTSRR